MLAEDAIKAAISDTRRSSRARPRPPSSRTSSRTPRGQFSGCGPQLSAEGLKRRERKLRLGLQDFTTETAAQDPHVDGEANLDEGGLRVGVKGGGCSGSATRSWERQPGGDEVFEGPEGAKIYVDRKSLLYLNGTVLDYDTNMLTQGFVFSNPNAKSTCGCGSSFGA